MMTAAMHVIEASPFATFALFAFNPAFGGGVPPILGMAVVLMYVLGYVVSVGGVLGIAYVSLLIYSH